MRTNFDAPIVGRAAAVRAITWLGVNAPAFGAHPLLTEDTGTQGKGRFELELGFERAKDGMRRPRR